MANLLKDMKSTGSIPEKIKDYNDANRKVAVLCNHKRTVAAGHGAQMEKIGDRIKGLKYQKWRIKQMMIDLDPKIKKKKGAEYFQLDDDLDQQWIEEHQNYLVEELRQKIEKKFAKENEKLVADGEKEMKQKKLEERLQETEDLASKFKKENKTGKVEAEGKGPSIEKLENNLAKLDQRINTMLFQAEDKENNKEVALGTSKIVRTLFNPHFKNVSLFTELYRSSSHCRLFQKIRCANWEVFLEDAAREVWMGRQISKGGLEVLNYNWGSGDWLESNETAVKHLNKLYLVYGGITGSHTCADNRGFALRFLVLLLHDSGASPLWEKPGTQIARDGESRNIGVRLIALVD